MPTCTGLNLLVVSLSPNPPKLLLPQVHNVPGDIIAAVRFVPLAETEIKVPAVDVSICIGLEKLLVVAVLTPS